MLQPGDECSSSEVSALAYMAGWRSSVKPGHHPKSWCTHCIQGVRCRVRKWKALSGHNEKAKAEKNTQSQCPGYFSSCCAHIPDKKHPAGRRFSLAYCLESRAHHGGKVWQNLTTAEVCGWGSFHLGRAGLREERTRVLI